MAQRPILVHISGALEADWLLFKLDWVAHDQDFCLVGRPHSQGLVCGKVKHSRVQLVGVFQDVKPLFVKLYKLLNAVKKLLLIEERHVKVLSRLIECIDMLLGPKALQLSRIGIVKNRDALVHRDPIVQGSRRCSHLDRAIGQYLGSTPASHLVPFNR